MSLLLQKLFVTFSKHAFLKAKTFHSIFSTFITLVHPCQVKSKAELLKALDDYNVGDKVTLLIQRGSEKLELPVELGEQKS